MAGIYIHIPFCKQKCTYCDFHFRTNYQGYRERMLSCIAKEIEDRSHELDGQLIQSIYFGGGTPSLLNSSEISKLIQLIQELHQLTTTPEITLECNPDDLSDENCQSWITAGVNRLSIGLQSFDQKDLDWMNRAHHAKQSVEGVKTAQKHGFQNISIDLIYGLPDMSLGRWKKQLDQAIDLGIQHISSYCLTVEEKTLLHHLVKTGKIIPAEEQIQSDHFHLLVQQLNAAGFEQYEVSNFAIPGYEAIHNSSYWKSVPYQGIGPSAHSFQKNQRSWNLASNQLYMKGIEEGQRAFEEENLNPKDRFNEILLTGLRTKWGVSLKELEKHLPLSTSFLKQVQELTRAGKIQQKDNQLTLTKEAFFFADGIAQQLFQD
ncbi:MAG: radical SAM family heme chaperone HemW [Bacteroidetes bacterium]|nr:MAG: radical SAM family heme chaperone HemW [Bacteroidota bacterium]